MSRRTLTALEFVGPEGIRLGLDEDGWRLINPRNMGESALERARMRPQASSGRPDRLDHRHLHPSLRHSSQVLRRSGQQELLTGTSPSSQAQPIELQDPLEVREQHLDFLPIITRLLVGRRVGHLAGHVA